MGTGLRVGRVGIHLAWAVCIVGCVYPLIKPAWRLRLKQRWSRQLLGILGMRPRLVGPAPATPGLIVANHISWLDIFAINAVAPAAFVCKAEVRAWPVIGWLCARTDTVFIERGNRSATRRASADLRRILDEARHAAVFPEGTTSDGSGLLDFFPALLQPAIDARTPLLPVALRYADRDGRRRDEPAYVGDTTFWQSLTRIAATPRLVAEVHTFEAVPAGTMGRRELAAHVRGLIAARLDGANGSDEAPRSAAARRGDNRLPFLRPA